MDTRRHMNRLSSYVILIKNNQVLLAERANTGYKDGEFALPAGHIEKNESFSMAAIREAKEEVGVDIEEGDLEVVHISHRKSDIYEYVDTYFLVKKWEGEPFNAEPSKCAKVEWFDLNKLPSKLVDYEKIVFQKIKEKIFYSEINWKK